MLNPFQQHVGYAVTYQINFGQFILFSSFGIFSSDFYS